MIPGQDTYPHCGFHPQSGCIGRQLTDVSLSPRFLSLKSINQQNIHTEGQGQGFRQRTLSAQGTSLLPRILTCSPTIDLQPYHWGARAPLCLDHRLPAQEDLRPDAARTLRKRGSYTSEQQPIDQTSHRHQGCHPKENESPYNLGEKQHQKRLKRTLGLQQSCVRSGGLTQKAAH